MPNIQRINEQSERPFLQRIYIILQGFLRRKSVSMPLLPAPAEDLTLDRISLLVADFELTGQTISKKAIDQLREFIRIYDQKRDVYTEEVLRKIFIQLQEIEAKKQNIIDQIEALNSQKDNTRLTEHYKSTLEGNIQYYEDILQSINDKINTLKAQIHAIQQALNNYEKFKQKFLKVIGELSFAEELNEQQKSIRSQLEALEVSVDSSSDFLVKGTQRLFPELITLLQNAKTSAGLFESTVGPIALPSISDLVPTDELDLAITGANSITKPNTAEIDASIKSVRSLLFETIPANHVKLAWDLIKKGEYEKAEVFLRRAIAINPEDYIALHYLGFVLKEKGEYEKAEVFLRRAVAINPKVADTLFFLGYALKKQGKHNEAEVFLRRAIAINPEDITTLHHLGSSLIKQGKHNEAEVFLRKAVAINPNEAFTLNNLGFALDNQGKHAEAEVFLRQAIDIDPNYIEAHKTLVCSLREQLRITESNMVKKRINEIVRNNLFAKLVAPIKAIGKGKN